MDLAEIQHAIEGLPEDQQTALAAWVAEREWTVWGAQIAHDFSTGGAGMDWLEDVKAQVSTGKSRPLSEGPPQSELPVVLFAGILEALRRIAARNPGSRRQVVRSLQARPIVTATTFTGSGSAATRPTIRFCEDRAE
jgi:hypothetical protein